MNSETGCSARKRRSVAETRSLRLGPGVTAVDGHGSTGLEVIPLPAFKREERTDSIRFAPYRIDHCERKAALLRWACPEKQKRI